MNLRRSILVAAAGLMLAGVSASAGTVFYSNFDTTPSAGASGSSSFHTYTPGETFAAWTVESGLGENGGSVDLLANDSSYGPTAATPGGTGAQSVDLDGSTGKTNAEGAIQASFATVSNDVYTLNFYLSGNNNGSGFDTGVSVTGIDLNPTTFTSVSGTWTLETASFTATGAVTTLNFASLDPASYSGPLLADVVVQGVAPAPTVPTPAAMAGGLSLLGLLAAGKRIYRAKI